MNDWYIDRSKNFYDDDLINVLINKVSNEINSNELIEIFKRDHLEIAKGNPNAALTRFRDHGLLTNTNKVGDSIIDYANRKLSLPDLIIDLFSKRPAKKKDSPNIKPFFILCKVFDIMFDMNLDLDDIFITFDECIKYLYLIDDYDSISFDLIDKIINSRDYILDQKYPFSHISITPNQETNLSIWFNALKMTPLFMPVDTQRNVLIPNSKQKEFFKFMSVNADEISETPTNNNSSLYEYYCSRDTCLKEIIPNVIRSKAKIINDKDIKIIFEYLFGYKRVANFNYRNYLKYECFGIFFPFITIPRIVIRKISDSNHTVGSALLTFIQKNNNYIQLYEDGMFEYKTMNSKNVVSSNLIGYNKIYYGIPGCGKSYHIEHNVLKLVDKEHDVFRTTFYLDYSNSDFIGQIYPKVDGDKVTYENVPGPFTKALKRAFKEPNRMIYLVIEEINRGNAAAIFGDIFQLLDRLDGNHDGRVVGDSEYPISNEFIESYLGNLVTKGQVYIPHNLTILATMNTSDQNVFPLDTAFKRRWDRERIISNWDDCVIKDMCIPFTDISWRNFAETMNDRMVSANDDGEVIVSEDKKMGAYFASKQMLVDKEVRHKVIDENKTKLKKFVSNVIDYLYNDVTKFDHSILFDEKVTYNNIYETMINYQADTGNNLFLHVLKDQIEPDITDDMDE